MNPRIPVVNDEVVINRVICVQPGLVYGQSNEYTG